ncbi:fibronectin type III domain-containing protein [uncultured Polaribacter sp.]|uniref:fibronectin type III domain-containing protein n=1 Tax=uncultured Polaribacter sp. TaxID=174711 RepID=UPI002632C2C2|nr:fibronectin type III domain-containing protein [uncultured Polaribacter sp.]
MKINLSLLAIIMIVFSCSTNENGSNIEVLPVPPSNLSGELSGDNQVTLFWTDNSTNENGFKIDRKENNNDYSLIGTVNTDITSFIDNELNISTSYTYRIYSFNDVGSSLTYSNQITINTDEPIALPVVTTNEVTEISYTNALCGGNITSDGGAVITERGVVWSTSTNPTINLDTKTIDGNGDGEFTSNLTDLIDGTIYYIRAYASNSEGTSYGNELTFTTVAVTIPELATNDVSEITSTTVVSGGNITSDGGAAITERGVVWSTSTNPTINLDTKTIDGNGDGEFTSNVSGLSFNVDYFIRAYATNSTGTAYGNEIAFTTTYGIGEVGPAGGFIFYDKGFYSDGWRYLEANQTDYSTEGVVWWNGTWNYQNETGISPNSNLGDGKANTLLIIAANNNLNNAAKVCNDFINNGYSDWYLPSIGELELMCQNLYSEGIGNFADSFYWSSTDTNQIHNAHWIQFPHSPEPNCILRTDVGRNMANLVRPIRQF